LSKTRLKIVQAESKSKFTCILPKRRLSKTRLKIVQAESKSKFTCILPRRRLSKTRLKIVQAGAMPDLFGDARASKKPVSGTRALK
ncbi:hypothetical protein, partial [Alistipes onderdonkii]|uniref:hypothetical protein n=1 Tax=Alistipes onderdonkii TaxID=328813 RepID=UPI001E2DFCCE